MCIRDRLNIGFILNLNALPNELYLAGNNILVDFAPTREEANCVMVVNPNIRNGGNSTNIDDYTKVISIGNAFKFKINPIFNSLFPFTPVSTQVIITSKLFAKFFAVKSTPLKLMI